MQPIIHEIKFPHINKFETQLLPNGATLHTMIGGTQPVVKIDIFIKAGSLDSEKPCVAQATSMLIQEGTQISTAAQIAEKIDYLGAYISQKISLEYTHVSILCLAKHVEEISLLVNEMLTQSTFSEKSVEEYKDRAMQEMNINMQKTSFLARRALRNKLFVEGNRHGRIAEIDNWKSIQRSDLIEYYTKYYSPQGAQIFISGLPSATDIKKVINILGESWTSKQKNNNEYIPKFNQDKQQINIEYPNAQQASLCMGYVTIEPSATDYCGLVILTTLLGGYFGSRLMSNLREEKGLTYGIGSHLQSNRKYTILGISSELNPNSIEMAIDEINAEMRRLQTEPIEEDELSTLTNYIKGDILRSFDNSITTADTLSQLMLAGYPQNYNRQLFDLCNTITAEDIIQLSNKYLIPDKFQIVTCR